jgi:tetratricopeptide (TPR) repeat protein
MTYWKPVTLSILFLAVLVVFPPPAFSFGVRVGDCWTDNNGVNHCGGGDPSPGPVVDPWPRGGDPTPTPKPVVPRKTPAELKSERAQNIYQKGYNLYQLGNYRAAEGYIVQALKMDPDADNIRKAYCAVKNVIGNQHFDQKNYAKALAYYHAGQSACPSNLTFQQNIDAAHKNMQWLDKRKKYDAAQNTFKTQQKISIERINNVLDDFAASHASPVSTIEAVPLEDSLRLSKGSQHSAPVDVRDLPENPEKKTIGPAPSQKGFKMKDVPLPPDIVSYYKKHDPFGGGPDGPTKTTDLILGALQAGGGSLADSVLWLSKQVREKGDNHHGIVALSYMEGLAHGAIPHDESLPTEKQMFGKLLGLDQLYGIPDWFEEDYMDMLDDSDRTWLTQRADLIKEALEHGNNDLYESLKYLERSHLKRTTYRGNAIRSNDVYEDIQEYHVGWGAYYYILGLSVYPGLEKGKAGTR